MSGYFKFAILAFLMLTASGATGMGIMTQELLEAEIRALAAIKEVEDEAVIGLDKCWEKGFLCSTPIYSKYCCSGACIPDPRGAKIYVCA